MLYYPSYTLYLPQQPSIFILIPFAQPVRIILAFTIRLASQHNGGWSISKSHFELKYLFALVEFEGF